MLYRAGIIQRTYRYGGINSPGALLRYKGCQNTKERHRFKPGYMKPIIAATAVGNEDGETLLITTCLMNASNVLDDGHLMPSNPPFKLHWRFVLNVNLKFQKWGTPGISRATSQGPAEEGQPSEVQGPVGKSYEKPNDNLSPSSRPSNSQLFEQGAPSGESLWSRCNADQLGLSSQKRLFLNLSTASLTHSHLGRILCWFFRVREVQQCLQHVKG